MKPHEIGLILGMTGVTFPVRYLLFAFGQHVAFPTVVRRALGFVPVAVLTAVIVPMVLLPDGQHWRLDWQNANLAGALAAGVIHGAGGICWHPLAPVWQCSFFGG